MRRALAFLYGIACYLVFLLTFLYAIGFVGNIVVPKSLDSAPIGPFGKSLSIDAVLLGIFAVQHSVMARPAFKRWWTRFVPATVERSTYVLFSSLALILLFIFWQPLPGIFWDVQDRIGAGALQALFWAGWGIVLISTFLIDHFDLFGLRQVWSHLRGREYTGPGFRTPLLYKLVRHPIMLGFLLAFWATPRMSFAHLVFAIATTGYILIGLHFEERDLLHAHGADYQAYRRHVRMLLPIPRRRGASTETQGDAAHAP